MPSKGKAPASDSIMTPDKMKPLLALSKQEPVQAAIGLTADGDGLLLLHKIAKPKKVLAMLRAEAGKAKLSLNGSSLRFGRAAVDTDYDAGTVRLFINKDVPGVMRVKLIELVKRIPYQKVEINVDPALEQEPEDETDGQAAASAPSEAAPPTPMFDPAALTEQLRGLLGQISGAAGNDAARKADLVKLAGAANVELKAGRLDAAAEAIARLRAQLSTPADAGARAAAAASGATAGVVALGKARLIWRATREKMVSQIDRLAQELRADYADEGFGEEIADAFSRRVAPILVNFDDSLGDKLDEVISQTDPAGRGALVAEARLILGRYQTFLASEPLIPLLDENPYAPSTLAATLSSTLTALSAAIR
jgi:hypothetical protein